MWRCGSWLLLLLPAGCWGQVWEGAAGRWVESGVLSVDESAALEEYLEASGLPVSLEEAAAIPGLSREAAARLMAEPLWARWVQSGQQAPSRSRLRLTWDVRRAVGVLPGDGLAGGPVGWGFRAQRSNHWALRCDRGPGESGVDHVAGFVRAPTVWGVKSVWGDHVIRWGQGLVGWSSSAYDGMRSATSAQRMTQEVRPVLAGDALPVRRGCAASTAVWGGQAVASLDAGGREARLEHGAPVTWYRDGQHRTEAERNRHQIRPLRVALLWHRAQADRGWGVATEWGKLPSAPFQGIVGVHGHRNFSASRWVCEAAWSSGGWSGVVGAIWTWSPQLDAFVRVERNAPYHPGLNWGDVRPEGGALCSWGWERRGDQMDQFARWEWNGEQMKVEAQTQIALRKKERVTLRFQSAEDSRILAEYRMERAFWGVRIWSQIILGQGAAGGLMWNWQPFAVGPVWRVGWSRSHLASGALVYRLEPNAQAWQTAAMSGHGQRWWVQGTWKWNRHWKCGVSAFAMHREDLWVLPDSGPWRWRGSTRGEVRVRLSYAM
jgi:hypothetical protein